MADDLTQLTNAAQQTERLIARLVVLFETGQQGTRAAAPAPSGNPPQPQPQPRTPPPAPSQGSKYGQLGDYINDVSKWFNDVVDASKHMSSEFRQASNTVGNLMSTFAGNMARLESSAAQAEAASKGELSKAQLGTKIVGHISGLARNLTQFGPIVGGIVSAVDIITDYMSTQRKLLETTVANMRDYADLEYSKKSDLSKVLEGGRTGAEINLEELENRKRDAAKRLNLSRFADSGSTNLTKKQRKELSLQIDLDKAKEVELDKKIAQAKNNIEVDKAAAGRLARIQQLSDNLEIETFNVKLDSAAKNYAAMQNQLSMYEKGLNKQITGEADAEVISKIVEVRKRMQQLAIDELQENYAIALNKLNNNPVYDSEGNVDKSAMVEKESALLQKLQKDLTTQKTGYTIGDNAKLTDDSRRKLGSEIAAINSALEAAIDKAKADQLGLGMKAESASLENQANKLKANIRDARLRASSAAKLAKPSLYYNNVDPMAEFDIKAKEIQYVIDELNKQAKTAVGANKAIVLAALTEQNLALKALNDADKTLAIRGRMSIYLTAKAEQFERDSGVKSLTSDISGIKLNDVFERQKRQLANSGTAPGAGPLLDIQKQEADYQRNKKLADEKAAFYEKEYNIAVKGNASIQDQVAAKERWIKAVTDSSELTKAQAIQAAKHASMLEYQLTDDKATFSRFNRVTRLGGRKGESPAGPAWTRAFSKATDFGEGLGSESARLTSDFNEAYRRRSGKLTPEEQAAAKEERRLNNQLERARRAVASGGGTRKQRELVDSFDKQKAAAKDNTAILVEEVQESNRLLRIMSGDPGPIKAKK